MKVGKILKEIYPNAEKTREYSAGECLNPKVCTADYFGHKIHYDQNKKLGMYGVVHVCALDGYSRKIATMAKKQQQQQQRYYIQLDISVRHRFST